MWEAEIGTFERVTIWVRKTTWLRSIRQTAAIICYVIGFGFWVTFDSAAMGQSVAASAQRSARTDVPSRVVQSRRFLEKRAWPRNQSRSIADRPTALLAPKAPNVAPNAASNDSSASTAIWQPLGPAAVVSPNFGLVTGRVSSIAIDPSDSTGNRVYLGTTGGGVWVSQNAGTSGSVVFTPLTDSPAAFNAVRFASISIGAVSVQPGGTGLILAGTGDPNDALDSYYGAGVLRSQDGGNTWTVMSHTADQMLSFQGEGFAGFAWSSVNPQLVVAAVSQAYEGTLVSAQLSGVSYAGLYYSADAGASWSLATINDAPGQDVQGPQDLFVSPNGNSATAVVWNPIRHMFIAAVRFHGYYQSSDGMVWTRMTAQPGSGLTAKMCPTNPGAIGSVACPMFRGALAVNPLTGDTFAWTVDLNNQDQGLWQDSCALSNGVCSNQTVAFPQRWSTASLETNTSLGATTIANGDYNLVLAAIPAQQDTLLLAGANDLWRCTLAMGCNWRNTTNATTCMSAQVALYQHALAWNLSNPEEIFIGNDSGLWRSTDSIGESGSVCSPTDASHFQNLNSGVGSLAEVESISQVGSSPYTMLAGLGVNGTAGVKSTVSPTQDWPQIFGGEGGPVAIDPNNPAKWYVNSGAGVSIYSCTQNGDCTPGDFGTTPVVDDADVAGDGYTMTSPSNFILDPLDSTQLLVGTCRLWRGPADGSRWTSANAISPILDGVSSLDYCSGDALIRAITALPLPGGNEVIYAGMYGALDGGATLAGHVIKATYNPTGSSMPTWQDLTLNPVINDQVQFNYYGLDISSIFIDPHDVTGNTAYVTVEGAEDSLHSIRSLYRTTDGGAHWSQIVSNLPHSPANVVVVDPQDANTVYVATDEGVYSTRQVATCANGATSCWSVFGTGLPFAPVVQLSATPATTLPNVLAAGTYGRGIWQIPLWTSGTQLTTASTRPSSLAFGTQPVGTTSGSQSIILTNSGGIGLAVTSLSATANFSETDNCLSSVVNAGGSCAIQLTFTPAQTGNLDGQLTINANISGGQIMIPLSGAGSSSGLVTASPGTLSFGRVQIGTTSPALPVTVENTGNAAFPVTSISVNPPFVLAANACGSSLAANSDCALSVTFNPTQAGVAIGTLTLVDGAGTQTVAISGIGATAATDALAPMSLSFPATAAGQQSIAQATTLTNSGDTALTSIAITVSSGFQQSSTCGTQLTGHASCVISVVFAPTTTGSISGNLSVSDAIRTQNVALAGIAVEPPSISMKPVQVVFTPQPVGQASSPLLLTISNTGGTSMSNVGFQMTGQSASSFSWSASTCGATLASASSCTVQLTFTPAAAGQLAAALVVTSSTLGVPPVQVPVSGIGQVASGIVISPVQMTFTQPILGQASAAQTASITNTGNVAATGLALSVPPPFSLIQNTCGSVLAAGASCATGVVFTPSTNGFVTGAFTVSSSAFVTAATAPLTGIGGAAGSIQVQPVSLSFPSTGVGSTGASMGLMITNNGSVALANIALSASNQFQLKSTNCADSLGVGDSCTAQVVFSPSSAGQQTGSVTISSSSLAAAVLIPLSGMGFDFSVSSTGQSSQAVSSGQTASYTVKLATMSGSSGTFTFACGSLPTHAACTFNPASESVSANTTGSVTVQIVTGLSSTSAQNADHRVRASLVLFGAGGLLLLPFAFRQRRRGAFLMVILLLAPLGIASCAGAGGGGGGTPSASSNNNTPAGTYAVDVTATANGLSHKITFNLTVD